MRKSAVLLTNSECEESLWSNQKQLSSDIINQKVLKFGCSNVNKAYGMKFQVKFESLVSNFKLFMQTALLGSINC